MRWMSGATCGASDPPWGPWAPPRNRPSDEMVAGRALADADVAENSAALVRNRILQQASAAILAQANANSPRWPLLCYTGRSANHGPTRRPDLEDAPCSGRFNDRQRALSIIKSRAGEAPKMSDAKTEIVVYRGADHGGLVARGEPVTARNAPAIVKAAGRSAE